MWTPNAGRRNWKLDSVLDLSLESLHFPVFQRNIDMTENVHHELYHVQRILAELNRYLGFITRVLKANRYLGWQASPETCVLVRPSLIR